MLVEEAFAVLRDAGLTLRARDALNAVLDQVFEDLDRNEVQWSQRLRYRALMHTLFSEERPNEGPKVLPEVRAAAKPADECFVSTTISTASQVTQTTTDVAQAVVDAMRNASIHPEARKNLTAHIEGYISSLRSKRRGAKYIAEVGTKLRVFVTAMGDKPIFDYSKQDILDYRDLVDQMPIDAIKHLKTDNIRMAIAQNMERPVPLPPISATTVNAKYLTALRGFFAYLANRGFIAHNVADGVQSEQERNGEDMLDVEKRLPFSPRIERDLFESTRKKKKDSADYWWPRINCRQGLRLQELTQLCVSDFRMLHGRLCLDLLHFDFDGDPNHALRRAELQLKSSAARRIVPVAQELLNEGVEAFIEMRRKAGGPNARLFPNEHADKYGNTSSAFSKRANREVRRHTPDRRIVAYSGRHTFAQRCDEAQIPQHIRNMFMGHEPEETSAGGQKKSRGKHVSATYGSPLPTPEDLAWFDKIKFPF
ncbi:integrase [Devosia subaequoris]|uniref:Integrase n=1 Tax=Devosia subaequoris TaxID=395930 RepID=A0A7W6IP03_9HYPH|nr:tyrosine-type recombinase/integrase [Devosia subaequoris]MBB4053118.1 integrase [Devosia subaequoris]MCP1210533.1 tyrosine-type recombinase/integrase [Devosia subaequoris]